MITLPPFLEPHPQCSVKSDQIWTPAVFPHRGGSTQGDSFTIWWPPHESARVRTVLFMIPGNPGLAEFYIPFLTGLYTNCRIDGLTDLAILAHSHLGHSPTLPAVPPSSVGLISQVYAAVEVIEAIRDTYSSDEVKVILIGHSVGSWIATQILKSGCRVDGIFLLFPTLSNIANTPNGRKLSWLFKSPFPRIVSGPLIIPLEVGKDLT